MRFGVCCSLNQARQVMEAGFDYAELPAGSLFGAAEEPDWSRFAELSIEATNLFVHGDLKLVGPDKGDVRGYSERVIPRAAKAGVRTMVIGSGAARKSPAGYDLDTAEDDFFAAASLCSRIGIEHEVIVAPESLRPEETNVGCFLGDFARMLAHHGVSYTADSYHVLNQPGAFPEEKSFWVAEVPFAPVHVHLSTKDRTWGVLEDLSLGGFVARLKELGYDGRVSLECGWVEFEAELPEALAQVQHLMR
ncbi:MAG: sugar phosphate isomerase/epimerase [Chlorobia bacterium]|nr:sugar phosphate isomerase/epimerase [Fimbriimonadaceae bacterium]